MKLIPAIPGETGALSLRQFIHEDSRGIFSHLFRQSDPCFDQLPDFHSIRNIYSSYNPSQFTFRGFHKQNSPSSESKIMRCITGEVIHFVLKTVSRQIYLDSNVLSCSNGVASYIPRDCFSAFLTTKPNSTVIYLADADYDPVQGIGIRWNDPILPKFLEDVIPHVISEKDLTFPDYKI